MSLTNPVDFVEAHLQIQGRSQSEYSVLCVFHKDTNASMRINVDKGVFFCHGCGVKGGMVKLARQLGVPYRFDAGEARMASLMMKLEKLNKGGGEEKPRVMPESMLTRYTSIPTNYWTDPISKGGRGFNQETVEAFDLGYDPLNDAAIIPIRNMDGELLGVTKRYFNPDGKRRYKDPLGFKKTDNLFASWFAKESESPTIVICEGPLDAIKIWQAGHPAVALFGSHVTEKQILLLRRMGTVSVVLFFDNDDPGRKIFKMSKGFTEEKVDDDNTKWVYTPETDLRRHFVVKRAKYPSRLVKDPGSMSDRAIELAVATAVRVS